MSAIDNQNLRWHAEVTIKVPKLEKIKYLLTFCAVSKDRREILHSLDYWKDRIGYINLF